MEPIRSLHTICVDYELTVAQTAYLKSLIYSRKGTLHPYWLQLAFNVPYSFAKQLCDDLIDNEWAVPDQAEIDGKIYETELSDSEVYMLARIELFI